MVFHALRWTHLKHRPSLVALFFFLGLGMGAAVLYPLRCAVKSPDVSWNKQKNPEPWNDYKDKPYKFYTSEKASEKFKNVASN